jgi:hypothetical protein
MNEGMTTATRSTVRSSSDRRGVHLLANTGSGTISRLVGTGQNVFVDNAIAANIATGGAPADIDADSGRERCGDSRAARRRLKLNDECA